MVASKKTITDQLGNMVTGDLVEVEVSTERFSEITLADGTRIKIKPVVVEAIRVDGQYDNEGNPMYVLQTSNVVSVSHVDKSLKKGAH